MTVGRWRDGVGIHIRKQSDAFLRSSHNGPRSSATGDKNRRNSPHRRTGARGILAITAARLRILHLRPVRVSCQPQ